MYNEVDGTTATSNAPLRGGKATMYEGGVRGPAIVVHPGSVPPRSRCDEIIQSVDFYPTLLDMLDIAPQPQQTFDGMSIVPALTGGKLDRSAIFTYFPHSPSVPDWLPPSVSVHHGDWKLIRVFHGGDKQMHRYKLFNLRDDIGEQEDLASKLPDRVQQLDALIEKHLRQTQAALPLPNPDFDPALVDLTLEGKAELKGSSKTAEQAPAKKAQAKRSPPVAGWVAAGTCTLSIADGCLTVHSSGGDPHLSYQLPDAIPSQPMSLQLRLQSTSLGQGQLFWRNEQETFAAPRSQNFEVTHDNQSHLITVQFEPEAPISAIRIDPSRDKGVIQISAASLLDINGAVIHHWGF